MGKTALLIIDVQNDYFTDGKMPLPGAGEAGTNIRAVLDGFRKEKIPVIHIQHESIQEGATFFLAGTDGVNIHKSVLPEEGEAIIIKNYPNSFLKTELLQYLRDNDITKLVITGMMTFMCVDATTRAAKDLGFECILLHDCTAAPPTEFAGVSCSAEQVRAAVTSALSLICDEVIGSQEFLERLL